MRPIDRSRAAVRNAATMPVAIISSLAVALGGPAGAALAAEPESRAETRPGIRSIPAPAVAAPALAAPAVAVPAKAAVPATYVVRRGDTVSGIASRYGLRTADVLALNGLSWSSIIRPGQVLKLRATPKAAKPAATYRSYTVKAGDTVSGIAGRAGVSTQKVLAANGLSRSSIIYPGQRLRIPVAAASAAKTTPKTTAKAPKSSARTTHTVRAGDTVTAIARAHGVSVAAVLAANGLGWSSIIYPGQKLAIPGAGSGSGAKTVAATKKTVALDAAQTANAKLIISVGRRLGVPERGIAIALGAAMQESGLRNLDYGDRDSLGLFQQRPSTGWGTAAQVRDRERAIRAFFGGAGDPNGTRTRGLLDIPGWKSMTFAQAAQAVQISAYPDRYAQWEDDAKAWLKALG